LLNIHGVNDVSQTEMHSAEPLVYEASFLRVKIAIVNLKRYKLPGIDEIAAELIQAGGNMLCSEMCSVINSIWNNEELPQQWKGSVVCLYNRGDKTDCSNYRGISLLPTPCKILSNILFSSLSP